MENKSILFDSSDFVKIIENGNIYVDKTELLYRLISGQYGSRFFISRPRRFGKSLMLSTLKAIFSGERELFSGLAISATGYAWPRVPVVLLDMSSVLADNVDELKKNIVNMIRLQARAHGVSVDFSVFNTPSSCFGAFLDEMSRVYAAGVAILVDEYDAPVNRLVEQGGDSTVVNSVMHDFYMQFKVYDSSIRFLMMTGVSKFAKLSVFSGLNNLQDLTLEPEYAGLLGYTIDEIRRYFENHIEVFAQTIGKSSEEIFSSLLKWYDGYRFSPYCEVRVTNPVSLALALERKRFAPFWDETGYSLLIYKHLKNRQIIPAQLNGFVADKSELNYCNIEDRYSPALLFQAGYLTIDEPLPDERLKFKVPNQEIMQTMTSGMFSFIFRENTNFILERLNAARERLQREPTQLEAILNETLSAAFRAVPYDWTVKDEPEARRMFLFYCNLMGADVCGEVHSSIGRADAVLLFDDSVFIFEFKYAHTAQLALQQAEAKDYAGPYMNGKRTIYLVGVNYNPDKRNIDPPYCKVLQRNSEGSWESSNLQIADSMGTSELVGNGEESRAFVGEAETPESAAFGVSSEIQGKVVE